LLASESSLELNAALKGPFASKPVPRISQQPPNKKTATAGTVAAKKPVLLTPVERCTALE
jgi:hypothetical protein